MDLRLYYFFSMCELLSRYGGVKSAILRKLKKICFALYQLYIELKTKRLFTSPSNVLPLHSSQSSNVNNILPDLDTNLSIVSKIYRTLNTIIINFHTYRSFRSRIYQLLDFIAKTGTSILFLRRLTKYITHT